MDSPDILASAIGAAVAPLFSAWLVGALNQRLTPEENERRWREYVSEFEALRAKSNWRVRR